VISLKYIRQWLPGDIITALFSLKAPDNVDVGCVFIELVQRVGLPSPKGGEERVGIERIISTFEVPGTPKGLESKHILKLNLPILPPTICLGPVDISYEVRSVVAIPQSHPSLPAIVEFLGAFQPFILPELQR
jgi:hypothetical protein